MRHLSLPAALLLPLALVLYLLPGSLLPYWRMCLLDLCLGARSVVAGEPEPPAPTPAPADPTDELRMLRERLALQEAEIASLRRKLAQISDFRRFFPVLRFHAVSVVASGGRPRPTWVVLDHRDSERVRRGTAVTHGQALVGMVSSVGRRASLAYLLASPRCVVPARVADTGEPCVVRGRADGTVACVFHGARAEAAAGGLVVTSGLLGDLPSGLLVGTLEDAPSGGAEPNTLEAPLAPKAPLDRLETLLLVERADEERPGVEPE